MELSTRTRGSKTRRNSNTISTNSCSSSNTMTLMNTRLSRRTSLIANVDSSRTPSPSSDVTHYRHSHNSSKRVPSPDIANLQTTRRVSTTEDIGTDSDDDEWPPTQQTSTVKKESSSLSIDTQSKCGRSIETKDSSKNFEWTTLRKAILYRTLVELEYNPFGVKRNISLCLAVERFSKLVGVRIDSATILSHLETLYNFNEFPFPWDTTKVEQIDFTLPSEWFDQDKNV